MRRPARGDCRWSSGEGGNVGGTEADGGGPEGFGGGAGSVEGARRTRGGGSRRTLLGGGTDDAAPLRAGVLAEGGGSAGRDGGGGMAWRDDAGGRGGGAGLEGAGRGSGTAATTAPGRGTLRGASASCLDSSDIARAVMTKPPVLPLCTDRAGLSNGAHHLCFQGDCLVRVRRSPRSGPMSSGRRGAEDPPGRRPPRSDPCKNIRMAGFPTTSAAACSARRRALMQRLERPILIPAGAPVARNYPGNTYPFRASSHFLYLVGQSMPGAALLLAGGRATLFAEPPDRDDALWHGPRPELDEVRRDRAMDEARPLGELASAVAEHREVATLPPQDAQTAAWITKLLGRPVEAGAGAALTDEGDAVLADAIIALRLVHDDGAVAQLRAAGRVSSVAHVAGMRATRGAKTEAEVCAAIVAELRRAGMDDAYGPIVTVRGEVLHNHGHDGVLSPGDLLLCDVGGESPEGWASDITRTWPVTGRFSDTQRAIYDVVLEA
ncbi:MAG: aminopeptidase P N-terminal domain-containing protein, partial [Myxococcales bacterium]|nr:aminopeptidase P N-terminal domain-containing protein [Myxococcales bacterium]